MTQLKGLYFDKIRSRDMALGCSPTALGLLAGLSVVLRQPA